MKRSSLLLPTALSSMTVVVGALIGVTYLHTDGSASSQIPVQDTSLTPTPTVIVSDHSQCSDHTTEEYARDRGLSVVSCARSMIGTPFVFGASGPDAFDDSGFTQWVYTRNGLYLPRTSKDQVTIGDKIDLVDIQPGDRIFFQDDIATGIYAGNNEIIGAMYDSVRIYDLNTYRGMISDIRRSY